MGCLCLTWTPTPSNRESHKTTREAEVAPFAKSWQRVLINAQIAAPLLWAIHIGCPKNCNSLLVS
jgi:hypothetical protein